MYVDLRDQPPLTEAEADVCIIGAGAAGITIARELSGRSCSVALLEAGGLTREAETQALYRGESTGLRYGALDETRFRYFGGSTNAEGWGGWCKPLYRMDFEERSWVPYSGWPLTREDLEPWYWRAQVVCEAGPFDYDLESWRERLGARLGDFPLVGDRIVTELAQLSPPTRFGRRYRDELGASRNVRIYLHANATAIRVDRDGSTAEQVEAVSLQGHRLNVACRYVVLAAGGIENARLLLLNPDVGKNHDLVGRFFADHPCLAIGSIDLDGGLDSDLYDPYFKFRKRNISTRGFYDPSLVAGSLAVAPEVQRSERLLGYRAWIVPKFLGNRSEASEALKRLYIGFRERELRGTAGRNLRAVVRRPDQALATGVARFGRPKFLTRRYQLVNILEPEPIPESRVMLGTGLDRLGLPKVRLEWKVGPLVRRTLAVVHELLAEDLRRSGLGNLMSPFRVGQEERFLGNLSWVKHHIGTTRMHDDPEQGVVDANCRVHSASNVYVAGSSVFPTSGNDMPTLTIVALAIRLADHLLRSLDVSPSGRKPAAGDEQLSSVERGRAR